MCLCVYTFSAKCNGHLAIHIPSNNCELIEVHVVMGDGKLWCISVLRTDSLYVHAFTLVFMNKDSTFNKEGFSRPNSCG